MVEVSRLRELCKITQLNYNEIVSREIVEEQI